MNHRVLILGAAGRDFHVFNTVYRDDPSVRVVAFTAQQIPHIDGRQVSARTRRAQLSGGNSHSPRGRARSRHRPGGRDPVRHGLLGRVPRVRDAHGESRQRGGPGLRDGWGRTHHAALHQARGGGVRVSHGCGEEPDLASGCEYIAQSRPERCGGAPPHALRGPAEAAGAALRRRGGPRLPRGHHRGARRVRTPHRQRLRRVRRRRLRGHSPGRRSGGRRGVVGRRQQRHLLLQGRRLHHPGRSTPPRARAGVLPR